MISICTQFSVSRDNLFLSFGLQFPEKIQINLKSNYSKMRSGLASPFLVDRGSIFTFSSMSATVVPLCELRSVSPPNLQMNLVLGNEPTEKQPYLTGVPDKICWSFWLIHTAVGDTGIKKTKWIFKYIYSFESFFVKPPMF